MDEIWDRKSFEVRGRWPSGGDEKTEWSKYVLIFYTDT